MAPAQKCVIGVEHHDVALPAAPLGAILAKVIPLTDIVPACLGIEATDLVRRGSPPRTASGIARSIERTGALGVVAVTPPAQ